MRAIRTKYLGPTNNRPSRIKVIDEGWGDRSRSIVVPWDHALDVNENHKWAARVALLKWEWYGRWVGGGLRDGMCFTCDPRVRNTPTGFLEVEG